MTPITQLSIAVRPILTEREITRLLADRGASGPELLEPSASTISRRASDLQLRRSQKAAQIADNAPT
jgi:hypothetical protein